MQKVAGGITTQLIFDRAGHLLEEADGSGTVLRDYIWLDDLPVAMVDDTGSSPAIYYIHTDQLGTPRKMTDGSANIVWENLSDPFGNPVATQGTNWGGANWGGFNWAVTMLSLSNLRFPGQYFDGETGLNQNWNRDYDPTMGQYIESDPIGLTAEGTNTYAYVEGNPVSYDDPFGLSRGTVLTGGPLGLPVVRPSGDIDYYDANGNLAAQYHVSHGEPHGHNIGPGFNRNDHVPMCPIP